MLNHSGSWHGANCTVKSELQLIGSRFVSFDAFKYIIFRGVNISSKALFFTNFEIFPQEIKLRIKDCKKLTIKKKYIQIKFLEKEIKSNKTIDLINY